VVGVTRFTGYLHHVDFDGTTILIVGHNRMSRMALNGPLWKQDIVLQRSEVVFVDHKTPSPLAFLFVNARTSIYTATRRFDLHYRRKQRHAHTELLTALDAGGAYALSAPPTGASRVPPTEQWAPELAVHIEREQAKVAGPPPPMGSQPAGWLPPDWYVDPGNDRQWRYWDGHGWTDRVAPR
jgi:hypothetical protein